MQCAWAPAHENPLERKKAPSPLIEKRGAERPSHDEKGHPLVENRSKKAPHGEKVAKRPPIWQKILRLIFWGGGGANAYSRPPLRAPMVMCVCQVCCILPVLLYEPRVCH